MVSAKYGIITILTGILIVGIIFFLIEMRKNSANGNSTAIGTLQAADAAQAIDSPLGTHAVAAQASTALAVPAAIFMKTQEKQGNRVEKTVDCPQWTKKRTPRAPCKEHGQQKQT